MRRALAALLAAAAGGAAAADTPEPAHAWVARMAQALATREYDGVFVYVHDGRIETMRVVRTIGPDGPRDEIVALTGDTRGFVRENGELRSTGNGITTVSASGPAVVFGTVPAALLGAAHYRLSVAGEDRVAGYRATVVEARPADEDRYAYRLWIERESGMLLRSALAAPDGTPIEQLMFTTLALRPDAAAAQPAQPPAATPAELAGPRYSEPLPAGFRLVAVRPPQQGRRHFVYSDGLANVSVYVEPLARGLEPISGGLRRGAINLYGHVANDNQIVVVGDVPVNTAHRIAVTLDPTSVR